MDVRAKQLLYISAIGNFAVGALHYIMPFLGPSAYEYFGAPNLAKLAREGDILPMYQTYMLALIFFIFGLMFIAGIVMKTPPKILRLMLWIIAFTFTLRGIVLLGQFFIMFYGLFFELRHYVFSLISLVLGIIQIMGLWKSREAYTKKQLQK